MRDPRGFTLIELLVVIAIIGLLSSVVLASLNTARARARDAAIQQQVLQLRNIMHLQFADSGSYEPIRTGGNWKGAGSSCTVSEFSGSYATQADSVCDGIVSDMGTVCSSNHCLYFRYTNPNATDRFTIMAYLPGVSAREGVSNYFCAGSSGATSIGSPGSLWTNPGCYSNP